MTRAASRETAAISPTVTLLAHLDLALRATAEVEDLYSRPIPADVVPLVTGDHRVAHSAGLDAGRDREAA
jgi:hypothetical protein